MFRTKPAARLAACLAVSWCALVLLAMLQLQRRAAAFTDTAGSDSSFTAGTWTYSATVLGAGPVAFWPFEETTGSNVVDTVGSLSAALTGGYTLGAAGATTDGNNALTLNGTTGVATAGDVLDFVGRAPFSLEGWVNQTAIPASGIFPAIISKDNAASTHNDYQVYIRRVSASTMGFVFARSAANSEDELTGPVAYAAGGWHHVAATYDGTTMRLYVDGVAQGGTATSTASMPDITSPLRLGRSGYTGDNVKGSIDEIAVYDRALTSAEVADHYARR